MRALRLSMNRLACVVALSGLAGVGGCTSNQGALFLEDTGPGFAADVDLPPGFTGDASPGLGVDGGAPGVCDNLCLKQVTCAGAAKTTVTGTVYDPAGKVPLYDVVVYVPNAPLAPLTSGATCDRCGTALSGAPLVATLSDEKGNFALENVPVGQRIPLVIQNGKWRRQVEIPTVTACTATKVDASLTHLPRNQSEGNIPLIAIATGAADSMECLPRRMGIDDSEFTTEAGSGRIHLYRGFDDKKGNMPSGQFATTLNHGASFTSAGVLWGDLAHLSKYDLVVLSCEGTLNPTQKPATARQALYDYEKLGGRVFASHWHRYWFSDGPLPIPTIGTWQDFEDQHPPSPLAGTINTGFPKGMALADWLVNVGASMTRGQISISDARDNVHSINASVATEWISTIDPYATPTSATEFVSYNAPIDGPVAAQCGRAVYNDLHVSVSSGDTTNMGLPFPQACKTGDLSDQEKVLEFLLFDLSACITSDSKPPPKPPSLR